MNHRNLDCETFEPLLGAMLDGELDSCEREELLRHVDHCPACQEQIREFEKVDMAVEALSHQRNLVESKPQALPAINGFHSLNGTASLSEPKPAKGKRLHKNLVWRLVPFAAAAALLICLGMIALPDPDPAAAEQMPPEQIVEPMKEFLANNFQQQNDQELMLRTLGWDLRAMKLEINQLEQGSVERTKLESQIDAMISKVQRFQAEGGLVMAED